jgi:hypothetical protein
MTSVDSRPLGKGDRVVLCDSQGWRSEPMIIIAVTAFVKRVKVDDDCGREYRRSDGAWWGGERYWPFPSIERVGQESEAK